MRPEAHTQVRFATTADAESLASIYDFYVRETTITFEEDPVSAAKMAALLEKVLELPLPWLVAVRNGVVVGYAYANKWRERAAYRHSVEVSIFVDHHLGGQGIGSKLYRELLPALRALGMHVAIGGIALPNDASIAFHVAHGFDKVAEFREVGFKLGRWIDVGYWQKIL